MSTENVDTVRSALAAFADGDIDAVLEPLHEDVEMRGAVGGLEEGEVERGREAVANALRLDSGVWTDVQTTVQDVIDAGDRVVALVHETRRGRGSGVEVETDIALVYWFRDGKVFLIEPYMSQSDALASVGMP